jgi:ABC-2 type transport system permease protein
VLLFFVFMMLVGAGPPKEVLPAALSHIADGVPVTHAGRLIRGPWMGQGWDGQALLFVLTMLAASLALTAWRLRREADG